MIISNTHRFVFIHIPKCAGTTVRNPIASFNDWKLVGPPWQKEHSVIGRLDYGHIPLFTLREYFEEEFEAVTDYWSFAVVRDPFSRFASSVSQHSNRYSDKPIQKRSLGEVRAMIEGSIDFLSRQPREQHLLPPEYIHFQKQLDYVELNGMRIVDKLYTVDNVNVLLEDVGRIVGQKLVEHSLQDGGIRRNSSVVYRNDILRRVIETARPFTNRLVNGLSDRAKQKIRDRVYVPRDKRMTDLFSADNVQQFIRDYYADDILLFHQVNQHESNKVL